MIAPFTPGPSRPFAPALADPPLAPDLSDDPRRPGRPAGPGGRQGAGGLGGRSALCPRQPDRVVHRPLRQQEARARGTGRDARDSWGSGTSPTTGATSTSPPSTPRSTPSSGTASRSMPSGSRRACLNRESRIILDVLKRHGVKAQLWVLLDLGGDRVAGAEQERRVAAAAAQPPPAGRGGRQDRLLAGPVQPRRLVRRAREPARDHRAAAEAGHHQRRHRLQPAPRPRPPATDLAEILAKLKPYLVAINLNGMDPGGDRVGRKILPLGQGSRDLELLRTIRDSGYRGPIGILGHTMDDAEERLRDNLDGLDWLLPQLDGKPAGPRPKPRTPVPPRPATSRGRLERVRRRRAGLRPDRRRPRTRRSRPRGRRVRLAPVRLPVVPQGRRSGRDGRPRPLDGRRVHQARGDRRIGALARPQGQGGLRGGRPSPRPTAGSSRATSRPRRATS